MKKFEIISSYIFLNKTLYNKPQYDMILKIQNKN